MNENNYKTGTYSEWKKEYCNLSNEDYEVSKNTYITYKKIPDAKYISIENVKYDDNIKIFYDNKEVDFEIMSIEENKIKIKLNTFYLAELLLFFVDTTTDYKINIYSSVLFTDNVISKELSGTKFSIPDVTWITKDTYYSEIRTTDVYENSVFTTKLKEENVCRYREIFVYKYDIEREYYDDNYYLNLNGYIKDTNDYKVYYKGEPIKETIINTVEIPVEVPIEVPVEVIKEKIVKVPQVEYIYTEQEKIKQNDSSQQQECSPETITKTKIQKEIVEKEIPKIPKLIYIIIFVLIITIIILVTKLHKKYVA